MTTITASVGERGINRNPDVRLVQALLNRHLTIIGGAALKVDGGCGPKTIDAIKRFQKIVGRRATPDGRVDPGGATLRALDGGGAPAAPAPITAAGDLSGTTWWRANQAKYSNSSAVSDLETVFGGKVKKFISAMTAASASVNVSATKRSKIRAYLMHYSWKISKGLVSASAVPAEPGCPIKWDHGTDAASRKAATEMVGLFGIVYQPSLTSRHISSLAIDMTINWSGTLTIKDGAGKDVALTSPSSGANTGLHKVGATYGVIKLLSDPPHWSDNGH